MVQFLYQIKWKDKQGISKNTKWIEDIENFNIKCLITLFFLKFQILSF